MTAREYKKLCRIKVTRLSKFFTFIALIVFFSVAEYFQFSGYVTAAAGTTIWFYVPDVVAYQLEKRHKLKHDRVSHR